MKKFLFLSLLILVLTDTAVMAQTPKQPPICTVITPDNTSFTYISDVKLDTISNPTHGTSGYSDYRAISTTAAVGLHNTITVTSSRNDGYTANWKIYIDYNRNGFEGDAGELVASGSAAAGSSVSFTFTIPATAFGGPATLRVVMTQSAPTKNCISYNDSGETEDYTLNITGSFCYSHGVISDSDYISNVTLSDMSKTSGNDNGYANYTSSTASLTSGFTYPVSLLRLPSSGRYEYWTVFIDYNNNKSFADAGELVALARGTNVSQANIRIPFLTTSMTGIVGMRVIMSHTGYKTVPCDAVSYGEVEDYSVKLLPAVLGTAKTAQSVPSLRDDEVSVSVQPNPAKAATAVVRYTVALTGNVNIRITDLGARSVSVYHAGNKMAGTYTYALSSSHNLGAGIYLLAIEQNGQEIAHTKFIITP